jgi:ABC-2 type transport system permease protein
MHRFMRAIQLGLERSVIEFKQMLRNPQEIVWMLIMTVIFLGVIWFQRNKEVEGISLALLTLPGLLGMTVAQGGFSGVAGALSYDREDGTLLRAKATPQGMTAYVVSRTGFILYSTLLSLIVLFVPALFFVDGLTQVSFGGALTLVGLFVLGMFATAPFGAIIGSLVKSSSSGFGLTFLPFAALVAISGIFYPIAALAGWIQAIAQAFPIYWLGHGFRSVFLPETAVAELHGSWQLGIGFAVMAAWSVVGFAIAPRILRRMARRESGATMQQRKEAVMQRGY